MIARAMQTRTPVREKATGMKRCFSRLESGASKDRLLEALVNGVVSGCLHKCVVKKGAACRQGSEACGILYFRPESFERRWTMHCSLICKSETKDRQPREQKSINNVVVTPLCSKSRKRCIAFSPLIGHDSRVLSVWSDQPVTRHRFQGDLREVLYVSCDTSVCLQIHNS